MSYSYRDLDPPRSARAVRRVTEQPEYAVREALAGLRLELADRGVDIYGTGAEPIVQLIDRFRADLLRELEELKLPPIVRVRFEGNSKNYCYRDPSGTLRAGERVLVPVGGGYAGYTKTDYEPTVKVAKVTGFGRGNWTKPVTKSVLARLREERL